MAREGPKVKGPFKVRRILSWHAALYAFLLFATACGQGRQQLFLDPRIETQPDSSRRPLFLGGDMAASLASSGRIHLAVYGCAAQIERVDAYTYAKRLRRTAAKVSALGEPEGVVTVTLADCLRHVTVAEANRLADLVENFGD